MKSWKKLPTLLWLLTKRLYKKPTFLVLLVLIPVLIIGYRFAVKDDAGVLTVGLTQQTQDPLSDRIFRDLQEDSRLIRYEVFPSPEKAKEQLQAGKLDAVWVFPENLQAHIDAYAKDPGAENAFITVLERTDNVALAFSRERLTSTLYRDVAKTVYVNHLRENAPELNQLSDAQLLEHYENTAFSSDLFTFAGAQKNSTGESFLLSPLRGLLGVILTLCGLAAAMQYSRDEEYGTFLRTDPRQKILPEIGSQLVAVFQLAVLALLCLTVCGLSGNFLPELALLFLYTLCVAAFSMLLRQVFGSVRHLAMITPVLCVLMLVVCPVFFDAGALRKFQFLLPPTYYINAVYSPVYLGYLAIYSAVCFGLRWLMVKLKKA